MTLDPDTYRKQLLLHIVYLAGLQDMDWREPSRPPPPRKKLVNITKAISFGAMEQWGIMLLKN